ncbi:hypothetical protein ACMFMG_010670 [Clarireedia jacksonii]
MGRYSSECLKKISGNIGFNGPNNAVFGIMASVSSNKNKSSAQGTTLCLYSVSSFGNRLPTILGIRITDSTTRRLLTLLQSFPSSTNTSTTNTTSNIFSTQPHFIRQPTKHLNLTPTSHKFPPIS